MNSDRPLVTVVMPFHNDAEYVGQTIDGLADQYFFDRGDLEIIAIDDGSEKEQAGRLYQLQEIFASGFARFYVESVPWGGKNKAIEAAKPHINPQSKFTFIQDSDDVPYPVFVGHHYTTLHEQNARDPRVVMVYSDNILIDQGGIIFARGISRTFSRETYFATNLDKSSNYVPGNALVLTGRFIAGTPDDLETANQDKKLRHMAELGKDGLGFHIPRPTFFYRQHHTQMSGHWDQLRQDPQFGERGILDAWPKDVSRHHWRSWLELPNSDKSHIFGKMPVVWNETYWQHYTGKR